MDRRGSIGGSDAGPICDVSPYKSPLEVYLEKMGHATEREATCSMMMGTFFEPMIADSLAEATGLNVIKQFDVKVTSPDHDWMTCRADGLIDGERGIVECKTTFSPFSDLANGKIPDTYMLQCQHNIAVHGADYCYLAYYVVEPNKSPRFNHIKIERDDSLIADLIKIESRFWYENVLKQVPPSIRYDADATSELLKKLHPQAKIEAVKDVADIEPVIESYTSIQVQIKELEAKKEALGNEIKHTLGDYAKGMSSKYQVSWANQEVNRLDTQAIKLQLPDVYGQFVKKSSTRVLRIKELING